MISPHMKFRLHKLSDGNVADARADEALIGLAARGQAWASAWHAAQGLVVPRTYLRSPSFEVARQQLQAIGWPVDVRHSGGGVVPQGPGIINMSLAFPVTGKPLDHSDSAYLLLCRLIAQALDVYGISTRTQAVEGSFCDGRYNLATGPLSHARKVAGTAQVWRRPVDALTEQTRQVVLVHAVILAEVDVCRLTDHANLLERLLGHDKHYRAESTASLHTCAKRGLPEQGFTAALARELERQVAMSGLAQEAPS